MSTSEHDSAPPERLRLFVTGGVAGLQRVLHADLDPRDLPEAQRRRLRRAMEEVSPAAPAGARRADGQCYEIELEVGGKRRRLVVDEGCAPPDLLDLIDLLRLRARQG